MGLNSEPCKWYTYAEQPGMQLGDLVVAPAMSSRRFLLTALQPTADRGGVFATGAANQQGF